VISVGAVDDAGEMASFSNRASFLSLLAPGVRITSAGPGATYRSLSGTSMAAPHVAGAFALLRQHDASASVDAMLEALAQTGAAVMPPEGGLTFPLIDVKAAIDLRSGKCPCLRNTNNFCLYASGMCAMTAPGGYCDPNADGDLLDGDWQRGFAEYHDTCVRPPRRSPWFSGQRSQSLRREPLTPVQRAQAHR
jgi:hypothetical protein